MKYVQSNRLAELNIVVALYTDYICLYVCKLGIW
jgi:hypothetical protein